MAFSVIGAPADVSLTWQFGDTPYYRFILVVHPNDGVIYADTLVDFEIRIPHGERVFEQTLQVRIAADKSVYFDVYIPRHVSLQIPTGNYVYTVSLKRPHIWQGVHRYSPISSAPLRVMGDCAQNSELSSCTAAEYAIRTIVVQCTQISGFCGHPITHPEHGQPELPFPPPVGYGCACTGCEEINGESTEAIPDNVLDELLRNEGFPCSSS